MNNIIYDDNDIKLKHNRWENYKNFTIRLNERDCVKFSLFCAKIVNNNSKESNDCIELVEKWLLDGNSVTLQKLYSAAIDAYAATIDSYFADNTANAAYYAAHSVFYAINTTHAAHSAYYASSAAESAFIDIINIDIDSAVKINNINKYLQVLLRKTKQFQNNQVLEQISKTNVDKLELVDWNMITDIMQEEYNIIHEFNYEDIFSRRCLIELLRREYA